MEAQTTKLEQHKKEHNLEAQTTKLEQKKQHKKEHNLEAQSTKLEHKQEHKSEHKQNNQVGAILSQDRPCLLKLIDWPGAGPGAGPGSGAGSGPVPGPVRQVQGRAQDPGPSSRLYMGDDV